MTVDGFPIPKTAIDFLPDKADPSINRWSYGKVTKFEVFDGSPEFRINMKPVTWKGKTIVVEYDLFMGMIRDWMRGCTEAESKMGGIHKQPTMTKEEALDLAFSM